MVRQIRLVKNNFQKNQNIRNDPLKLSKTKSKKCSGDLMLKTKNIQTQQIDKQENLKNLKTQI